ncbi:MAG: hypothetical protein K2G98_03925, partial [Duncaniella sp.]|nr:hypothetical protein [Duncaniella sp.]
LLRCKGRDFYWFLQIFRQLFFKKIALFLTPHYQNRAFRLYINILHHTSANKLFLLFFVTPFVLDEAMTIVSYKTVFY